MKRERMVTGPDVGPVIRVTADKGRYPAFYVAATVEYTDIGEDRPAVRLSVETMEGLQGFWMGTPLARALASALDSAAQEAELFDGDDR